MSNESKKGIQIKIKQIIGLSASVLAFVGGLITALLFYSQTFNFFSSLFDFLSLNWTSGIFVFAIGALLFVWSIKRITKDFLLMLRNPEKEITVLEILKFFIGGVIGCYALFAVMWGIVIVILSLVQMIL